MFWKKSKKFLQKQEQDAILQKIKNAEATTSVEIRLYIEPNNKYMQVQRRAEEIFYNLKMYETQERNAILIYIAYNSKEFGVFADKNAYEKMPKTLWNDSVKILRLNFSEQQYLKGIEQCIAMIGEQASAIFPISNTINKNELPDEIIFG